MARRRGGRLPAVLILTALAAACAAAEDPAEVTTITTPSTTITAPPPTTTVPSTSTTATSSATTTSQIVDEIDAEVRIPDGDGPFPAVVVVHGGGWVAGSPANMRALAEHLTEAGYITINTRYQLAGEVPGYPAAMEDVACAVNFAASHPDGDGTVVLLGHSAGAHIGAVVALAGDQYVADCPYPGAGTPQRFVGLAGPYDVSRLSFVMTPFFGGSPAQVPEAWAAGNPQLLTDENPTLSSLIMYGDADGLVDPSFAIAFHNALLESGSESLLEVVEGATHQDLRDPAVVGDLVEVWLDR